MVIIMLQGLNKMNKCTTKSNIKQCYYGMHNIREWLIWQWLSYLWLDKFLKVNEMDYAHGLQNGAMTRHVQYAHSLQNGTMTRKVSTPRRYHSPSFHLQESTPSLIIHQTFISKNQLQVHSKSSHLPSCHLQESTPNSRKLNLHHQIIFCIGLLFALNGFNQEIFHQTFRS